MNSDLWGLLNTANFYVLGDTGVISGWQLHLINWQI